MDSFIIANRDGSANQVPCCYFVLNDKQQAIAVGCDFEEDNLNVEGGSAGVEAQPIGKLSEQNFIMSAQLTNSLVREAWDFDKYPDPEIILMTDHR